MEVFQAPISLVAAWIGIGVACLTLVVFDRPPYHIFALEQLPQTSTLARRRLGGL
eukprot:CAMPEP_0206489116 /NCGR_PEP_ID=MMETSP0324_2-20121206/42954_1 /ASSEMBLY_ACC=CAM_ASM_000836 /TAXON_ID=2866 /ORGANISM="Crypthecodinium cohnii, Strain Seligo" /LENGTH=54 /DNA_ID=CAMNT_0053968545 /DNA_START=591 /DNA_END=755 /DNA_ORIENTATION=+